MASHDPDELWPELEALGLDEVRKRVAQGVYGERKRPNIAEWIRRKEDERKALTWMYHPVEAPNGKIFSADQVRELEREGWYDSSDKFPVVKPSRLRDFWIDNWKWIVTTTVAVIAISNC